VKRATDVQRLISVACFAGLIINRLAPSADALGYMLSPAFAGWQFISA
jgi:hypothetical protein